MQKIQVIGNVTADAVVRDINGRKAINFNVAVNERYKDKDGVKVEKASFHSCTIWRDAGQSVGFAPHLLKGTKVFVEGNPDAVIYTTKDNKTAIDKRITVNHFELLSAPKKDNEPGAANATTTESSQPVSENNTSDDLPF